MSQFLKTFANDESGATAIEYGLIAALVSVVIIVGLNLLGPQIDATFQAVAAAMAAG